MDDRYLGGTRSTPPPGYEEYDAELSAQEERLARGGAPGLLDSEEIGRVREFLEGQLRARPLPTLLVAVAAGWLAGKLLK